MSSPEDLDRASELRAAAQLHKAGKLGPASFRLKNFIASYPDDVEARTQLAQTLVAMGNRDGAISEYVKTQELLADIGDILGAITAGLKVVELDPDFDNPLAHVARFKLEFLQEKQAHKEAQVLMEAGSSPLPPIPLLSDLTPPELSSVAATMRRHELDESAVVFEEGALQDSIYFVHRGRLEARANGAVLGRIEAGQCFGEFSFLTNKPTIATVRALSQCELLELSAERMRGVVRTHPRIREVLFALFRDRALVNVLSGSPLFAALSVDDCATWAPLLERVWVAAGDAVLKEGDHRGTVFLVVEGEVVFRARIQDKLTTLATLGRHRFFGEVSFLTGIRSGASAYAKVDTELLQIEPMALRDLLTARPLMKQALEKYHLDRVTRTDAALREFLGRDRIDGILG